MWVWWVFGGCCLGGCGCSFLLLSTAGKGEDGEESSTETPPASSSIEAVFGDKPRLVPTLPEFVHQTGEENDMVVVHVSGGGGREEGGVGVGVGVFMH